MKIIYKCNHVYKSSGLPIIKEVDTLCPDCQKKSKMIKVIYDFEEENELEHFTTGNSHKRHIASEARFRLLVGTDTHWLQEKGLLAYMDALYTDIRPHAGKLLERVNIIIHSDMDYWYNHRYCNSNDIIKDIEIGGLE